MSAVHTPYLGKVQFGPVYRCWACGAPAAHLIPYHLLVPPPTDLDEYAHYIAYLALPASCEEHLRRVVVVGPAITPLSFPYDDEDITRKVEKEEKLQIVAEAIAFLAQVLEERPKYRGSDAPLATALRLYNRVITPAQGAQEIRTLMEVVR